MLDSAPLKPTRPPAVTIVGILIFLSALVNLIVGGVMILDSAPTVSTDPEALVAPDASDSVLTEIGVEFVDGLSLICLGSVQLGIGIAFWMLLRWAWIALMTWLVLDLLIELAGFFVGTLTPVALVSAIVLVFLLNQSDVRRAFGILHREHEAKSRPPLIPGNVN